MKHRPNGSNRRLTSDSNVPRGTCYHLRANMLLRRGGGKRRERAVSTSTSSERKNLHNYLSQKHFLFDNPKLLGPGGVSLGLGVYTLPHTYTHPGHTHTLDTHTHTHTLDTHTHPGHTHTPWTHTHTLDTHTPWTHTHTHDTTFSKQVVGILLECLLVSHVLWAFCVIKVI